jgi:hypothetical protein
LSCLGPWRLIQKHKKSDDTVQESATYCFPLSILVAVANVTVVSVVVPIGTAVTTVCPSETVVDSEKIVDVNVSVIGWPSVTTVNELDKGSLLTGPRFAPRTLKLGKNRY